MDFMKKVYISLLVLGAGLTSCSSSTDSINFCQNVYNKRLTTEYRIEETYISPSYSHIIQKPTKPKGDNKKIGFEDDTPYALLPRKLEEIIENPNQENPKNKSNL